MFKPIKFLIKACIVFIIMVVVYKYLSINQQGRIDEVNHFQEVGEGIGKGVKEISRVPGKIINSEEYQDLKNGIKNGYKDTTQ